MTIKSNIHSHTTYCDGDDSAEIIILKAIELGYESIGFSSHANTPFDETYCMSIAGTKKYTEEITMLKKKYEGQIEVYLGIERDFYSRYDGYKYDFVIGDVHYLKRQNKYLSIDDNEYTMKGIVRNYYSNDYIRYCREYYMLMADVATKTHCDIIGHFDVIAKFNEGNKYFDEADKRYTKYAIDALEALSKSGKIFEVNTGAMFTGYRTVPYPAPFLLKKIKEFGGNIMLTSDTHKVESLGHAFAETQEMLRSIGFTTAMVLRGGIFTEETL